MVAATPCGLDIVTMYSGSNESFTCRTVYPEAGLGAAREIVVQWTTKDAGRPVAMVGTAPGGPYTITANATSTTYLRNDMCGSIAATCAPRLAPSPANQMMSPCSSLTLSLAKAEEWKSECPTPTASRWLPHKVLHLRNSTCGSTVAACTPPCDSISCIEGGGKPSPWQERA